MTSVFYATYVLIGQDPSMMAIYIIEYTMPIGFATWVQSDARQRRSTPTYDFGFFIYLVLWIALPWYLIRTRRWWGILIFLMFCALAILPSLVARIVWEFMYSGMIGQQ